MSSTANAIPALAALGFAAAGAVGYGMASILQAVGAQRGAGTMNTLRQPIYLAGLALDLLAWLSSLAALRTLPVYEVQALLAGSLAVTVVAARVFLGSRIRRTDAVAVVVAVVCLAVLVIASQPLGSVRPSTVTQAWLALSAAPIALLGWLAARAGRASVSAALAGLAFGGAALCARSIAGPDLSGDAFAALAGLVGQPLVWSLAVFGVTGMLLYANALEHGNPGAVTAVLWIVEVIAPAAAGVAFLGDRSRPGWGPVAVISLLGACASAVQLATVPTDPGAGRRHSALRPRWWGGGY